MKKRLGYLSSCLALLVLAAFAGASYSASSATAQQTCPNGDLVPTGLLREVFCNLSQAPSTPPAPAPTLPGLTPPAPAPAPAPTTPPPAPAPGQPTTPTTHHSLRPRAQAAAPQPRRRRRGALAREGRQRPQGRLQAPPARS